MILSFNIILVENETEECSIAGKLANCVIEEAQKVSISRFFFLDFLLNDF